MDLSLGLIHRRLGKVPELCFVLHASPVICDCVPGEKVALCRIVLDSAFLSQSIIDTLAYCQILWVEGKIVRANAIHISQS